MRHSKLSMLVITIFLISFFIYPAFSQDGIITISAKDFWLEFQNDKHTAESKYIGQTMNYTGVVVGTGISIYMTPNVMLSDNIDGSVYLICVLSRGDVDKLSQFKKGDTITMNGRVYRSKTGGGVVIKECKQV